MHFAVYFIVISLFLSKLLALAELTSRMNKRITGISQVIGNYDVLILDQWGVLHDGKNPYIGAIQCLERIKENQNIIVIMLSNSSKRVSASYKGLSKVGFANSLFDSIVTSGEIGHERIKSRSYDFLPKNKSKLKVCVFGNNDEDEEYLANCDCVLSDPEDADFVLARGSFCFLTASNKSIYKTAENLFTNLDGYLARCAEAKLPMIVTNPDMHRPGSNSPMPGQIGNKYNDMYGLPVEYIGKPYQLVYDKCLELASIIKNKPIEQLKLCAIGDSLDHDIEGAKRVKMDSIWIANGVHGLELGTSEGSSAMPELSFIEKLFQKYNVDPTYTIPNFNF